MRVDKTAGWTNGGFAPLAAFRVTTRAAKTNSLMCGFPTDLLP